MEARKGFSLVEIIVALVIVGIGATLIIPNVIISMEQTKAQAARNNLLAIAAAQQRYFEDNASYCTNTGASPTCGGTTTSLVSGLRLSISATDPFTYTCSIATAPYSCGAVDGASGVHDNLTLTVNAATMLVTVTCIGTPNNTYCPS